MTQQLHRRLTRAAVLGVVQQIAVIAVLLTGVRTTGASLVLLILGLLLLLAWGPYQALVALNAGLDERGRRRWRIALWLLPVAMTLYWYRYVRDVRALD